MSNIFKIVLAGILVYLCAGISAFANDRYSYESIRREYAAVDCAPGEEKKKADAQKTLKNHESSDLLRKDKIAIINIETQIQEFNQEIHLLEGQIDSRKQALDENNKKLEKLKSKSFLDKLIKQ